jgi:hypothetical protein
LIRCTWSTVRKCAPGDTAGGYVAVFWRSALDYPEPVRPCAPDLDRRGSGVVAFKERHHFEKRAFACCGSDVIVFIVLMEFGNSTI